MAALQILQSESHPNSHNQGPDATSPGSKEGLSVYGLFHRLARTPQGKSRLRQYFIRPSLDLEIINERLNALSVLLRPDNATFLDEFIKAMKHIRNMKMVMLHLRKGMNNGNSKSGGIKSGVWTSIRAVSGFDWKVEYLSRSSSRTML